MLCILNSHDIIYEILKHIDIHEFYRYKYITKQINTICNNIIYKKNKKYMYIIKNFIKPSLFQMIWSFNDTYTYYYGLFIRLEPIISFINKNVSGSGNVSENGNVSGSGNVSGNGNQQITTSSIKNINFNLLQHSLENDISFKLMDISFEDIYKSIYDLQIKLKNGFI